MAGFGNNVKYNVVLADSGVLTVPVPFAELVRITAAGVLAYGECRSHLPSSRLLRQHVHRRCRHPGAWETAWPAASLGVE
jgi:hypothetical protein